jgi:hypothetical protein
MKGLVEPYLQADRAEPIPGRGLPAASANSMATGYLSRSQNAGPASSGQL